MGSKADLQVNNIDLLEILGIAKNAEVAGTPYTGDNPLTIGKDGYTFPERTLLKEGLEVVNGVSDEGKFVWKKYEYDTETSTHGDFINFVVSSDEEAYPDSGTLDGHWYKKVVEGITGIDYGEVTITSATTEITVAHNLKAVPSNVFLIPLNNFFDGVMSNYRYIFNGKINNIVPSITKSVSDSIAPDNLEKANILTDTEITFTYNFTFGAYETSEFTRNTTFMWFAVV